MSEGAGVVTVVVSLRDVGSSCHRCHHCLCCRPRNRQRTRIPRQLQPAEPCCRQKNHNTVVINYCHLTRRLILSCTTANARKECFPVQKIRFCMLSATHRSVILFVLRCKIVKVRLQNSQGEAARMTVLKVFRAVSDCRISIRMNIGLCIVLNISNI